MGDAKLITMLATDGTVPGFGVYLTDGGKTVYGIKYTEAGVVVQKVIGKVSKISLKKARKAALKMLPQVAATPRPTEKPRDADKQSDRRPRKHRRNPAKSDHAAPEPEAPVREVNLTERKPRRLLRFPELKLTRGISYGRRQIDRLEAAGKFPKRVKLGGSAVGWVETEVDEYLERIIAARR